MQDSKRRGGAPGEISVKTDNDGRGRREALDVRFFNAKQDTFE